MARIIKVLAFGVEKELEVTDEFYREYMRPEWREQARRRREYNHGYVYSTEKSSENGYEVPDDFNLEDYIIHKEMFELLLEELNRYTEMERDLILGKFDKKVTLEMLAKKYGLNVPKTFRLQKKLVIMFEEEFKKYL